VVTYRVFGPDWGLGLPTYLTWYVLNSFAAIEHLGRRVSVPRCSDNPAIPTEKWRWTILIHRFGPAVPPRSGFATWETSVKPTREAGSVWERLIVALDEPNVCRWDEYLPGSTTGVPVRHEAISL